MTSIGCRDLHYSFNLDRALNGVDLEIERGESVAVAGPSGCGKSTLLLCLAGVLVPERGTVSAGSYALGLASDEERSRWRAENCGFVMQFGDLVDEFTVAENLLIPGLLRRKKRRRSDAAHGLLGELGIADLAHRLPGELSGGQRQRVAVARALVEAPAVVFADEPTGALDSANGDVTIELLLAQARKVGSTLIVVTHEERHLPLFDRVVHLSDGRVVA